VRAQPLAHVANTKTRRREGRPPTQARSPQITQITQIRPLTRRKHEDTKTRRPPAHPSRKATDHAEYADETLPRAAPHRLVLSEPCESNRSLRSACGSGRDDSMKRRFDLSDGMNGRFPDKDVIPSEAYCRVEESLGGWASLTSSPPHLLTPSLPHSLTSSPSLRARARRWD